MDIVSNPHTVDYNLLGWVGSLGASCFAKPFYQSCSLLIGDWSLDFMSKWLENRDSDKEPFRSLCKDWTG